MAIGRKTGNRKTGKHKKLTCVWAEGELKKPGQNPICTLQHSRLPQFFSHLVIWLR